MEKKVIIIGAGPAGISASLYIKRAGIDVAVIHNGGGALKKAEAIGNFYGFPSPIGGKKLYENGISQAKALGVEFIEDEVVGIGFENSLTVITKSGKYEAERVVIATGAPRKSPDVKGLSEFEGRGVSYCAVCDAFFYRGKDVAVIGNGDYALHEANVLAQTSNSVTILTNGSELSADLPENIKIDKRKLSSIEGKIKVEKVRFDDGSELLTDGVFVAVGVAGSADLARKIGAMTENGRIIVNESCETTVPGLYACGDCTGGLLQIAKAVYEGAVCGLAIVKAERKEK